MLSLQDRRLNTSGISHGPIGIVAMTNPRTLRPSAIPWPPLLSGAAIGAAVWLGRSHPLPWPGIDDLPAKVIGYGLGILGVGLMAWGAITLLRADTTVLPHKRGRPAGHAWSLWLSAQSDLHGRGADVSGAGAGHRATSGWRSWRQLFAIAVLVLAILPEERHLEARFGEDYLAYKDRTRRWF